MAFGRNKDDEEGEGKNDLKMENMLLKAELDRLMTPPYVGGTILEIGKKTAKVGVDGTGVYELLLPDEKGLRKEMRQKLSRGGRVSVNPGSKAIIDFSEFNPQEGLLATVDEVSPDRLKIQADGKTRYVLNAAEGVKPGDEVLLDPSGVLAIERIASTKTKYNLEEIKEAPWSNIGGLEQTIREIKEEIEDPFVHREVYQRYGRSPVKGILLYGPPGCGKTMIAKSIAYNLAKRLNNGKGHFINVKGPEILDKFVGNSEANIRRIYAAARESANGEPVIVFIDEAESVLKTRGTGVSSDVYDSIVPQLLVEMDGLQGNGNVITVLATNRPDIIDPAVLRDGRVDRKIKVPRPDKDGAREIFDLYLKNKPVQGKGLLRRAPDLAKEVVDKLYDEKNPIYRVTSPQEEVMGNFHYRHIVSGAMIKGIVDRATGYAIRREIAGKDKGLTQEDMHRALNEEIEESTSFSQALSRDDWQDVFGAKGRRYHDMCLQGYITLEKVNDHQMKGGAQK